MPAPIALPAAQGRFRATLLLPWAGCSWTPSRGPRCSPQPRSRHSPSGCSRYTAGRTAALSPRRRAERRGRHRGAGDTARPPPPQQDPAEGKGTARPAHGSEALPRRRPFPASRARGRGAARPLLPPAAPPPPHSLRHLAGRRLKPPTALLRSRPARSHFRGS